MIHVFDLNNPVRCQTCGEQMPPGDEAARPMRWFHRNWCCKHGATWTCLSCVEAGPQSCPVCGERSEYT